jgi:hypothetical protein
MSNIYINFLKHANLISVNHHYLCRLIKLLETLKQNEPTQYVFGYHRHHIIPRSWSNGDLKEKDNMIYMSPKAHFIVHHLMYKSFPKDRLMKYSFLMLSRMFSFKISAKEYEKIKYAVYSKKLITINKDYDLQKKIEPEHLERYLSEGWTIGASLQARELIHLANIGKVQSSETIEKRKISLEIYRASDRYHTTPRSTEDSRRSYYDNDCGVKMAQGRKESATWLKSVTSPEVRKQKQEFFKDRYFSEEHKARISESKKGIPKSKEHIDKLSRSRNGTLKVCIDEFVYPNVEIASEVTGIPIKLLRKRASSTAISHNYIFFI